MVSILGNRSSKLNRTRIIFGSLQVEIGAGKGRIEEKLGKIIELLAGWVRLCGEDLCSSFIFYGTGTSGFCHEVQLHRAEFPVFEFNEWRMLSLMLGIDVRAARATWTVFLVALVVLAAYTVRTTLLVFMTALFFAYMLAPVVKFVQARLPRRVSRTISLTLVYLLLLGVIVLVSVTVAGYIADEATSLANRLPQLTSPDWMSTVPLPGWLEPMRTRIATSISSEFGVNSKDLIPYVQRVGKQLVSGAGELFYVVLVPILAFFFLKDGRELRDMVVTAVSSGPRRSMVYHILNDIDRMLGQYIRSLVILSAATFCAYLLFLLATGAPYAILLALVGAVLEFIPVVGPLSAAIVTLVVTGFSGYPHLLWFALFWILSRLFQDYVLAPYLMSSGVELHPLLVLFGVLAGEQIGGIPGMFFSVPIIAILRVVYIESVRSRAHEELLTEAVE